MALTLPVILLVVLVTVDFGRALYGWVVVQNSARIAANFAGSYPNGWSGTGDADVQADYQEQIRRDLSTANCAAPTPYPTPVFTDGPDTPVAGGYADSSYDVGDTVVVNLSCDFTPITPIISSIVGTPVELGARSEFRIRSGDLVGLAHPTQMPAPGVTPTPTTGPTPTVGPTPTPTPTPCAPPVANFSASPLVGNSPLTVVVTDSSTANAGCSITSWTWTFEGGSPATGSGQGPHTITFTKPPTQHDITLVVTNSGGSDTEFKNNYVRTN